MDLSHGSALQLGARVAVLMNSGVAEIYGTPPVVTTATVVDEPMDDHTVWLEVDIAQGQTLPQRYKIEEVLGFMLPMAVVEHHADGSVIGRFPDGTVGP